MKTSHIKSQLGLALRRTATKGFTLIELLVVVAVLGVLAAGILIAIDPLEQINRGTDAGLKQSVANLGRALQAYSTSHGGTFYTPGAADWLTTLQTSGEIKVIPTNPVTAAVSCTGAAGTFSIQVNFCYKTDGTNAIIYANPISKSVKSLCPLAIANPATGTAWYVYSTADGRAGIVCTTPVNTQPTVGVQTFAAGS